MADAALLEATLRKLAETAERFAAALAFRRDHDVDLAFLGIGSSPAFVRAPKGHGCAERFIRTLKENLLWVRTFDTVEQLRQALITFRAAYNATWLIERHGFRPPNVIRAEQRPTEALAA